MLFFAKIAAIIQGDNPPRKLFLAEKFAMGIVRKCLWITYFDLQDQLMQVLFIYRSKTKILEPEATFMTQCTLVQE